MSQPPATRACDEGLAEWRDEREWIAEANQLYGQRGYGIVSFDHADYRRAGDVTPEQYVAEVTQNRWDADVVGDLDYVEAPDDYGFDDFCHSCGDPYCAGECRWWPALTEDEPLRSLGIPERLLTGETSNYGSAKADADRWDSKHLNEEMNVRMARATPADMTRIREFFVMLEKFINDGEMSDFRLVEKIHEAWGHREPGVGSSWGRVVYGTEVLLAECTDPDLSYLDWRPDLKALLEPAESKVGD